MKVRAILKMMVVRFSAPEQLVSEERESSENTELGGEEDTVVHVGVISPQKELIEFDNNLAGVRNDPKEREKGI